MKKILSFMVCSILFHNGHAQTDTIYLSATWKNCQASDARYFRLFGTKNGKQVVEDHYLNGTLRMVAEISSAEPLVKNGWSTSYDEQGRKISEGNFKDNNFNGTWTRWTNDGKDVMHEEYQVNGEKIILRSAPRFSSDSINSKGVTMPVFRGGENSLKSYIAENLHYPESAIKDKVEGIVFVSFEVDPEGKTTSIGILNGIRTDLDEAAIMLVRDMPNWTPGYYQGEAVRVKYSLPIQFSLSAKKPKK